MKIDKFVFWCTLFSVLASYLMILTGILKGNPLFYDEDILNLIQGVFGFCIFIYFLKDDNLKFIYYLFYVFSSIFSQKLLDAVLRDLFGKYIRVAPVKTTVIVMLITMVVTSFSRGYFYQLFKEKSYKKCLNNNI